MAFPGLIDISSRRAVRVKLIDQQQRQYLRFMPLSMRPVATHELFELFS
jgi:hypothetical protein